MHTYSLLSLAVLDYGYSSPCWTSFRLRPGQRKGLYVDRCPPPPPIGPSELIQLWLRLPAPHRQRLLWLLSQLLEHQRSAAAAQGEDSDASAPRYGGGTVVHREHSPTALGALSRRVRAPIDDATSPGASGIHPPALGPRATGGRLGVA